jgi:hypothetical protein
MNHARGVANTYIDVGYCQNDEVLQAPWYSRSEPYTYIGRLQDVDILWMRTRFPLQTAQFAGVAMFCGTAQAWEWNNFPTAGNIDKIVTGIVRDINGNPVSGATVYLFNTSTKLLVDTQTTGPDGVYKCGDPNNTTCFAVGYLAGSPDTTGATPNNLVGS